MVAEAFPELAATPAGAEGAVGTKALVADEKNPYP